MNTRQIKMPSWNTLRYLRPRGQRVNPGFSQKPRMGRGASLLLVMVTWMGNCFLMTKKKTPKLYFPSVNFQTNAGMCSEV